MVAESLGFFVHKKLNYCIFTSIHVSSKKSLPEFIPSFTSIQYLCNNSQSVGSITSFSNIHPHFWIVFADQIFDLSQVNNTLSTHKSLYKSKTENNCAVA
jgi:hypothetical protein